MALLVVHGARSHYTLWSENQSTHPETPVHLWDAKSRGQATSAGQHPYKRIGNPCVGGSLAALIANNDGALEGIRHQPGKSIQPPSSRFCEIRRFPCLTRM
jgi:hypothetical protein